MAIEGPQYNFRADFGGPINSHFWNDLGILLYHAHKHGTWPFNVRSGTLKSPAINKVRDSGIVPLENDHPAPGAEYFNVPGRE